MAEKFKEVENYRRNLLENIQVLIISPLEQFLRDDLLELTVNNFLKNTGENKIKKKIKQNLKTEKEALKEEYDQAKLKYDVARTSKLNKTAKTTLQSKVSDLEEAKRLLDAAEASYANKLFDIKTKKEFEIVERLCTYMFSVANLYHEGYQSLGKLEPSIRKLMADLVNAQN